MPSLSFFKAYSIYMKPWKKLYTSKLLKNLTELYNVYLYIYLFICKKAVVNNIANCREHIFFNINPFMMYVITCDSHSTCEDFLA